GPQDYGPGVAQVYRQAVPDAELRGPRGAGDPGGQGALHQAPVRAHAAQALSLPPATRRLRAEGDPPEARLGARARVVGVDRQGDRAGRLRRLAEDAPVVRHHVVALLRPAAEPRLAGARDP